MAQPSPGMETKPTFGKCFTVVLPAADRPRWPAGCAECGRARPVQMVRHRVHATRAKEPPPEPRIVMVPMCTRCRWQPGFWLGLGGMLCSAVFCLMNGIGKARHGVGPFLPSRWAVAAVLPLMLGGLYLMYRSRRLLDIAGDGLVLRWSFASLGFATQFAAAHGARIEPPTEHPDEPETEFDPILDEHDAM
ncbi:MAG: hypothetical protein MUC36_18440 [Planctomycetes bacterium]|nr:hypothetical protein [Planctomycetota bacterium]